jgi:hypothetical protein
MGRSSAPGDAGEWPELPFADWEPTYRTLHMYTQIVGKVRFELAPRWNQYWHVPFYTTARGMTTSPMPLGSSGRTLEIRFDFIDHRVLFDTSDGQHRALELVPRTVADFYGDVVAILRALDADVRIWPEPVEVSDGIAFDEDTTNASYDAEAVGRFWTITREIDVIFKEFRGRFRGKCSPVHFFWGSFDLAVTRFSGRRAPVRPGADPITAAAYDEEVSSLGFWPGDAVTGGPVIYSYMAPAPPGFAEARPRPDAAFFDTRLGEMILPYAAVRAASDPRAAILEFAESTYEAGARAAGWDLEGLAYGEAEVRRVASAARGVAAGEGPRPAP